MTFTPSVDDPFMTTAELAKTFSVSRKTIERWINSGKLKGTKIGHNWRVQRSEMIRFANERFGSDGE